MEQKPINFAIRKIKELEFSVNEAISLVNSNETNVSFELTTNVSLESNCVDLILTALFYDKPNGTVFMKIKTGNLFEVIELAELYNLETDSFNIPDNVMVTMLSLSISHTRALLAKNALGTKFADHYLPIVNPSIILHQLFN